MFSLSFPNLSAICLDTEHQLLPWSQKCQVIFVANLAESISNYHGENSVKEYIEVSNELWSETVALRKWIWSFFHLGSEKRRRTGMWRSWWEGEDAGLPSSVYGVFCSWPPSDSTISSWLLGLQFHRRPPALLSGLSLLAPRECTTAVQPHRRNFLENVSFSSTKFSSIPIYFHTALQHLQHACSNLKSCVSAFSRGGADCGSGGNTKRNLAGKSWER